MLIDSDIKSETTHLSYNIHNYREIDRLRMLDTMMRWMSVRDTVNRLFVSVAKCKHSDFLNIFFFLHFALTCEK